VEVLTSHCLPAVHHGFVLLIELAEKVCGPPSIGEEDRVTLQEIQERLFEITDDWPRRGSGATVDVRGRPWTSVAELDDMLHELEDVDQPDTPAVQELRERIEALTDEIANRLDVQLAAIADDPTGAAY